MPPTPPPMTEAEWQEQVFELAQILGWRHMHVRKSIGKGRKWTTATNVTGWPDAVLWSERQQRLIFVEFKSETGKPSPEQVEVLGSLRAAGQEVYLWYPSDLETAKAVLQGPRPTVWTRPMTGLAGGFLSPRRRGDLRLRLNRLRRQRVLRKPRRPPGPSCTCSRRRRAPASAGS